MNALVGLWFVPYLIHHLGVASYGLVPLATSVTAYFNIITLSLNAAVGRFLTIDLETNNIQSANCTFNTSLFGSIGISIAALPLALAILYILPYLFHIPHAQESEARFLFAATMASFLGMATGNSFSISAWARNRLDLQNIVKVIGQMSRVGIVILFFSIGIPRLWHVGIGILGATVIGFWGYVLLWSRLTPELRVRPSNFDRSRVRDLFGIGSWVMIDQMGTLLLLNAELIMVNILLGAKDAGRYGCVLQLSILLRTLAGTVAGVLTPAIHAKYAHADLQGLRRITLQSVKFMGLAMGLPIGLACGVSRQFLALWLGPEFQDLHWLVLVLLGHLTINLSVLPLFGLQIAFGKVRWPAIITCGFGIVNLLLALFFVKGAGWGIIGVGVAGAIAFTSRTAIFSPIYNALIQNLPWWTYMLRTVPSLIATLSVGLCSHALSQIFVIQSWIDLINLSVVVAIVYISLVYFIALTEADRDLLKSMIRFKTK